MVGFIPWERQLAPQGCGKREVMPSRLPREGMAIHKRQIFRAHARLFHFKWGDTQVDPPLASPGPVPQARWLPWLVSSAGVGSFVITF